MLLLLLGGVAVALAMNAFSRLALLTLGTVPLLMTLLVANKTLVVVVPVVPLYFHPSGLSTLACVVFVSSIYLQLGLRSNHGSSVTPLCRLPACSIVGLNHSLVSSLLVYDVEQCVTVMHDEIEPHLPFHLAVKLEWLYSLCYRLYQHVAMLKCVLPTTGLHHVREPAVSKVFSQGTILHDHPDVYRHAHNHLQHTEYMVAKIHTTRVLHINASKLFEPSI